MAKNGVEVIVKKNSKLETFLKRNLDVDSFEKIRAHEPCIVCSEKEDKAFKFVILSDDWMYLTENPPKKIYETVCLKDIVSIDLINDVPTFLQGEEQENAQHLIIRYLTDDVSKPPKSGQKEKKKEKEDPERSPSPAPTTPRSSRNSIIMPYGRKSFSARDTKEMKLLTARQQLAASRNCHTTREMSTLDLQDTSKHVQFGGTSSGPGSPHYLTANGNTPRPISPILKRGSSPSRSEMWGSEDDVTSVKRSAKMNGKKSKRGSDSDSSGSRPLPSPRSNSSKLTPRLKGELKLDLSKLHTSDSEFDDDDFDDDSDDDLLSSTTRSEDKKRPQIIVSETRSSDGINEVVSMAAREAVLHLYILRKTSKILMLMKTAWHNYIIRGTLEEDPGYVIKTTVIAPKSAQPPSEKLELLFRQLKTEMQYSTNSMVDIFYHIHELKVAVERNFALRKLFWKTPDVFRFMINQLKRYIPMTPNRLRHCDTDEAIKHLRADELEFLNLILETLALLFRETEIVPTRMHMMKSEAGLLTQSLISVLMETPEIPESSKNVSNKLRNLYTSRGNISIQSEQDIEIDRLIGEYHDTATSVLFELLMIGEQAVWCASESSLLSVSWVAKEIHSTGNVEKLIEHLVTKAMELISPRRTDKVNPAEAVLLYHQFYILRTLVDFNDNITTFIQNNFYEEFKYYIQGPVLQRKLPSSYLLRPYIFTLMENVISKVLQKKVRLAEEES